MSTVQIQNDIIDDFKILDGDLEMTLNYLMELGESLNDLDEKYKIDDNLVKGCQSKVWLKCTKEDNKIYLYKAALNSEEDVIRAMLHEYTHATQDPKKIKQGREKGYTNNPMEKQARNAEKNWKKYL